MTDPLYVMTPTEVAWGYVVGSAGELPPASDPGATPRAALERVIRAALVRPPCTVAFSGGRDSSAVLAIATDVARRNGLPDPLPVTRVFHAVPESEEDEWQEAVVRHLGLADWQRLEFDEELEVIAPEATSILLEHGVVWPSTVSTDVPLLEVARGGSLLDGEGGDEVLGVAAHRVAPLARLLRAPRPLRPDRVRRALGVVAPASIRERIERRRWLQRPTPWLRPVAREALIDALIAEERRQPLSFARSVRLVPRRRTQVLAAHNRDALAERWSVACCSPLLHPDVVQALAGDGGVLGRGDRTAVLRSMTSDLLPERVLTRTSKALFTRCYMGPLAQQFAADWDGRGVDDELVDPVELRRIWASGSPNALTGSLLQAAWLATNGGGATRSSQGGVADGQIT